MNPFFYLIGFRFYVFVIPIVIIFLIERNKIFNFIKEELTQNDFSKFYLLIIIVAFPLLITLAAGYLLNLVELNDPEYFYELGLSSIIDYPIYLIWNIPQFILLILILKYLLGRNLISILISVFFLILLFGIEIYNFKKNEISINILIVISSAAIITSFLAHYMRNIYYSVFLLITIFWFYILSFGSNNQVIVNIFFAKQFELWEGHFSVSKTYSEYVLPFYFILTLILFLTYYQLIKNKK